MWVYSSPLGMLLKVCDFGLSRKVPDVRYYKHTGDIYRVPFSRICGTGGYIPPEIIRKDAYGKPADLWSVGVICYRMLVGTLPFIPPHKCLEQPVSFKGRVWESISKDAQDFLSRLLCLDQNKRATAKEALAHQWMQVIPEWGPTPGLACGPSPKVGGVGRAASSPAPLPGATAAAGGAGAGVGVEGGKKEKESEKMEVVVGGEGGGVETNTHTHTHTPVLSPMAVSSPRNYDDWDMSRR